MNFSFALVVDVEVGTSNAGAHLQPRQRVAQHQIERVGLNVRSRELLRKVQRSLHTATQIRNDCWRQHTHAQSALAESKQKSKQTRKEEMKQERGGRSHHEGSQRTGVLVPVSTVDASHPLVV